MHGAKAAHDGNIATVGRRRVMSDRVDGRWVHGWLQGVRREEGGLVGGHGQRKMYMKDGYTKGQEYQ